MEEPSKDWPFSKMASIVFAVNGEIFYHTVYVGELEPDKFDVLLLNLFNNVGDVLFPHCVFEVFHSFHLTLIMKAGFFLGVQVAFDRTCISI